jgi:hypothetical protein
MSIAPPWQPVLDDLTVGLFDLEQPAMPYHQAGAPHPGRCATSRKSRDRPVEILNENLS